MCCSTETKQSFRVKRLRANNVKLKRPKQQKKITTETGKRKLEALLQVLGYSLATMIVYSYHLSVCCGMIGSCIIIHGCMVKAEV